MKALRSLNWLWIALLGMQVISAQTPSDLERKVELMIRLKFEIPTACDIKLGSRTPSEFTGYDKLRVTLSQAGRSTDLDFLISKDNKSLARLENFDLDHNPGLSIDIQGRPIRGNVSATVTVINFDDLECPVCARMHELLKSELMQKYGDKIRFIYKDNPLTEIHPWAMHAAVDAGCLAQQDPSAYWSFVDYVHAHGQEVSGEGRDLNKSFTTLDRIASDSGRAPNIDKPTLMACLRKQDEAPIRQSMKEAQGLGLNFTPALFVNGEIVRGLTTLDDPERAVERALRKQETK
jgi:protein-disulfide isomerase